MRGGGYCDVVKHSLPLSTSQRTPSLPLESWSGIARPSISVTLADPALARRAGARENSNSSATFTLAPWPARPLTACPCAVQVEVRLYDIGVMFMLLSSPPAGKASPSPRLEVSAVSARAAGIEADG